MAGTVNSRQQGAYATPVEGGALDASVVLGNDNTTRVTYNGHDADATIHVQSSTLASRPAAGTAQRFWVTTDGLRAYVDSGLVWGELAYLPTVGGTVSGPVVIAQGTLTTDAQALTTTATWNAAGVTFTHIKANVTNTASQAGSKLIDLQVGGVSQFSVNRIGDVSALGTIAGSTLSASANVSTGVPGTGGFNWNGGTTLRAATDGTMTLLNNAETDFGRLNFGGTTSSFPALKRSAATLLARLADDSAACAFTCAGLTCTTLTAGGAVTGVTSLTMNGALTGVSTLASGKQTVTDATFSMSRRTSAVVSLAVDATAIVSTTGFAGVMSIACTDTGACAIQELKAGNGVGTLVLNGNSEYSNTQDQAGKLNIYMSGANFLLQNKTAGTKNFRIDHFGS
jgi:hypothetical protein